MLRMPCWGVDRFLQVHLAVHVAQEKLRRPLILLIAAGRTPGEIRLALAQRQGRRQRRARTLARRERGGVFLFEPELLRARAEAETDLRDHRRRLQPAARWRRRDHVAGLIDNVEVHRIAVDLTEAADGRLAGAQRTDGLALALFAPQL